MDTPTQGAIFRRGIKVVTLIFTGGIGENTVSLREKICAGLTQIGIRVAPKANEAAMAKEAEISASDSRVRVFVIPTNEQAAIAKDAYELAGSERCDPVCAYA
jgi:acetate kinase